jgi:hypothetical protein
MAATSAPPQRRGARLERAAGQPVGRTRSGLVALICVLAGRGGVLEELLIRSPIETRIGAPAAESQRCTCAACSKPVE